MPLRLLLLSTLLLPLATPCADAAPRPRIGLVLSGGGGRGLAQIGVLKALWRHRIPVDLIVGTSFGSVVGGLAAAGYSPGEIESVAVRTNWSELLSFSEETRRTDLFLHQRETHGLGYLEIRFDGLEPILPSAISGGQRLSNFFSTLTLRAPYHPGPSFDRLGIPFRAVSTDLVTGRRVVIAEGSLAEAMRASVTVPLLYAPLERDSLFLVDGGLVANIPVDVARDLGCEVVVAVNTTSAMRTRDQIGAPWEVADQIMSIMAQSQNERQLALADVVISPETGERIVSDFSGVDSLIAAGERAAEAMIPEILGRLGGATGVTPGGEAVRPPAAPAEEGGSDGAAGTPPARYVVTGNVRVTDADVAEALSPPMEDGEREPTERLLRLYRARGYSLARVTAGSPDGTTGIVPVHVEEGTIAAIRYEGNDRTKDYIIRREFPLEVGEVFTLDLAERGLRNIKSTGLFEYVLMDVGYEEDRPVVTLRVKERSSEMARLGFRADETYGFVGAVSLRNANFRGAWEDLGITARYGERYRMLTGEYVINRIFNSYLTLELRGTLRSRDVDVYADDPTVPVGRFDRVVAGTYRESKNGWSVSFGSHFERFGDVAAEIRSERHLVESLSGTGYSPDSYGFVSLRLRSTADTKDKFLFPTTGVHLALSYESASRRLGSDVGFVKVGAVWESYTTVVEGHTLRPRVEFGFADQTLPLPEQFSLGGMESFFGLHTDDLRGRQLLAAGFEYRWRLPFRLLFDTYLRARYDLGMISADPEEIKFSRFRQGAGLQLSLDTPLGEVSAGLGKSFHRRADIPGARLSSGPLLFYFTVGPRF